MPREESLSVAEKTMKHRNVRGKIQTTLAGVLLDGSNSSTRQKED
jgi:hypothetical protein